jgi:NADH-quinone oxidoreductase subunit L
MSETIWLIPLIPLLSSVTLMLFGSRLKISQIGILGVASVGIATLLTLLLAVEFMQNQQVIQLSLWTWMEVAGFSRYFVLF